MADAKIPKEPVTPSKARRLAYWYAQGFEQKEAAQRAFPRGAPTGGHVSRLLEWAEEKEILRTAIDPTQFPQEELRRIRETVHHGPCTRLEDALKNLSAGTLQSLYVFNSGDLDKDPGNRLARFAANASWCVREHIRSSESGVIAAAFGATVGAVGRSVVRDAVGNPIRLTSGAKAIAIPTMGDPLGNFEQQKTNTSSAIAESLSHAFADVAPSPSLNGVWPVLPLDILDDRVESFRDGLWRKHSGYAAVFGATAKSPDALIAKADVFLSSAGFFHSPYWENYGNADVDQAALATRDEISHLAEGDVAGVLVPKQGLDDAQAERFALIMRHWMGIDLVRIRRIARNAADAGLGGPAGCVLCCIGHKARIVKHLICVERVVNHLLCDQELLAELGRLVLAAGGG
jgi:hypothetical protein